MPPPSTTRASIARKAWCGREAGSLGTISIRRCLRKAERRRVGATEKAAIERFRVHMIDASEESLGIINHDLFLWNAEMRRVTRGPIDAVAA
jgi:hypothetical protein